MVATKNKKKKKLRDYGANQWQREETVDELKFKLGGEKVKKAVRP